LGEEIHGIAARIFSEYRSGFPTRFCCVPDGTLRVRERRTVLAVMFVTLHSCYGITAIIRCRRKARIDKQSMNSTSFGLRGRSTT